MLKIFIYFHDVGDSIKLYKVTLNEENLSLLYDYILNIRLCNVLCIKNSYSRFSVYRTDLTLYERENFPDSKVEKKKYLNYRREKTKQ